MIGGGVRSGADFEAGRTHWRNERMDGAERTDGRDPEEGFDTGGDRRGSQGLRINVKTLDRCYNSLLV